MILGRIEHQRPFVSLPQNPQWIRGEAQNLPTVSNATKRDFRYKGEPATDRSLSQPRWCEERRGWRKVPCSASSAAPRFGECYRSDTESREKKPLTTKSEGQRHGKKRQLPGKAQRPREFVVGLSNALRPEVRGGSWASQNVRVEENGLSTAGRDDGSNELEILEHCIAIVSARRAQNGSPHAESAGPIATCRAVEEHPRCVPAGMPWRRIEIVLRPNDVRIIERYCDARKGDVIIPDIIVGDDQLLTRGELDSTEHVSDLAHRGREVGQRRYVSNERTPGGGVGFKDLRGRRVHDDYFFDHRGKPTQIFGEVCRGFRAGCLDRQDITDVHRLPGDHGGPRGNRCARFGIAKLQ